MRARHLTGWRAFSLFQELIIANSKRTRRIRGHVAHIAPSRSGKFWAVIKDGENTAYFAYGKSFLSFPEEPRIGRNCEFVALPPVPGGPLRRATEIKLLPSKDRRKGDTKVLDKITVLRLPNGVMQIRCGENVLGELSL